MPGFIPSGEVRAQMAISMVWMPTIAELCQIDLPDTKLDGKSLVPIINNKQEASRHDIVYWQVGDATNPESQWAVRTGNWKLIGNPRDLTGQNNLIAADSLFLVALSQDINEMTSLAETYPDQITKLHQLHNI